MKPGIIGPDRRCALNCSGIMKDRTPAHGYAARREAAMAPFAKSWRRE
jgi:hypothetical protein